LTSVKGVVVVNGLSDESLLGVLLVDCEEISRFGDGLSTGGNIFFSLLCMHNELPFYVLVDRESGKRRSYSPCDVKMTPSAHCRP
jgi:hypothetical protein